MLSFDVHLLAQQTCEALRQRQQTITAAESCTGGLFLSTLTDISGSSAVVQGGVVAYSNLIKEQVLGVAHQTLLDYGAVSEPTAREMAQGVHQLIGADWAISITGIAGPTGGTPDKPVGLVYIGLAGPAMLQVRRYLWNYDRRGNKQASVHAALEWLWDVLAIR